MSARPCSGTAAYLVGGLQPDRAGLASGPSAEPHIERVVARRLEENEVNIRDVLVHHIRRPHPRPSPQLHMLTPGLCLRLGFDLSIGQVEWFLIERDRVEHVITERIKIQVVRLGGVTLRQRAACDAQDQQPCESLSSPSLSRPHLTSVA